MNRFLCEKIPSEETRVGWESNINTNIRAEVWDDLEWIHLAKDRYIGRPF
jgi:hypothetical protein